MRHTYTHKLFLIHLKRKWNWVSCVLSGNPSLEVKQRDMKQQRLPFTTPGRRDISTPVLNASGLGTAFFVALLQFIFDQSSLNKRSTGGTTSWHRRSLLRVPGLTRYYPNPELVKLVPQATCDLRASRYQTNTWVLTLTFLANLNLAFNAFKGTEFCCSDSESVQHEWEWYD